VNIKWKQGKLEQIELLSIAGNECWLRYGGKELRVATQKGKKYVFNNNLERLK
jgi:alpha-L-fucosidase 2